MYTVSFIFMCPKAILLDRSIIGERPPWAAGPPKSLAKGIFCFALQPSPLVDPRPIDGLGDEPFGLHHLASLGPDGGPLGPRHSASPKEFAPWHPSGT